MQIHRLVAWIGGGDARFRSTADPHHSPGM
jgi:hypothetical protein